MSCSLILGCVPHQVVRIWSSRKFCTTCIISVFLTRDLGLCFDLSFITSVSSSVRVRFHGMLELEGIEGRRGGQNKKAVTLFPCKHAIGWVEKEIQFGLQSLQSLQSRYSRRACWRAGWTLMSSSSRPMPMETRSNLLQHLTSTKDWWRQSWQRAISFDNGDELPVIGTGTKVGLSYTSLWLIWHEPGNSLAWIFSDLIWCCCNEAAHRVSKVVFLTPWLLASDTTYYY
jgi:hypothetical protein